MKKKTITKIVACLLLLTNYSLIAQTKQPTIQKPAKGHQLYKLSQKANSQVANTKTPASEIKIISKQEKIADRAADRYNFEVLRTCDPKTGKIPKGIKEREIKFVQKKSVLANKGIASSKISQTNWRQRGPYNIGGRTRALAIDRTNENIILAGGVSGGMWRSENQGETWTKTTRNFQHPSVTCIAQDPRPGFEHIWYYGTGERPLGNSASGRGAFYSGTGMYKSKDGGRSWKLIGSTNDQTIIEDSPFDIINSIVIHPTSGDVYVATHHGIRRSQDGGKTWKNVLKSGRGNNTEIAITPSGRFYASVAGVNVFERGLESPLAGIYTSTNGTDWEVISKGSLSSQKTMVRTVFGINPSNENEIYIFSGSFARGSVQPKLFRYLADVERNKWTDLTSKLPSNSAFGVAGINVQFGYNMVVAVHPTNSNIVFVAGTNLYRSTDRFETKITPEQNNWIAGYSPIDDISIYPNQHPDHHALLFFPSNPNKVLSATDGGVFLTNNITNNLSFKRPVKWKSLNNGYGTTQPYTISFDPESKKEEFLAGFQDSGTWYSDNLKPDEAWEEELGGDGSYNAITNNGLVRYSSAQASQIFKLRYNEDGSLASSFRIVDTDDISANLFINPFVIDPIDDNTMYLPGNGRAIYINTRLDLKKSFEIIDNWELIPGSIVPSVPDEDDFERNIISALDVSRYPKAKVLYFGTSLGQLYRLENASSLLNEATDIFTDKGLPNGFVSSIQVDPSNHNRVLVTFSNYEIPSIFYTENGGETWVDISGNLEQNKDGSGDGPSVRNATFVGNNNGLLASTSSGLYFTNQLSAQNTVWHLESHKINNAVVEQIKVRKDGFALAAAHGSGVFSKRFNVTPQPENTLFLDKPITENIIESATTESKTISIANVFKSTTNSEFKIRTNIDERFKKYLDAEILGDNLILKFKKASLSIPAEEKVFIGLMDLIAESPNGEIVENRIVVATLESGIFESGTVGNALPFGQIQAIQYNKTKFVKIDESKPILYEPADDFVVPDGEKWIINGASVFGTIGELVDLDSYRGLFKVIIYEDDAGKPGDSVYESELLTRSDRTSFADDFKVNLNRPIELTAGTYWFSFISHEKLDPYNDFSIHIVPEDKSIDNTPMYFRETNSFLVVGNRKNVGKWLTANEVFGLNLIDNKYIGVKAGTNFGRAFKLFGTIEGATASTDTVVNLIANSKIIAYPNPSLNSFTFKIKDGKEKVSLHIVDILGQTVYENQSLENDYDWDASNVKPGIYFAKIKGANIDKTIRLIKN